MYPFVFYFPNAAPGSVSLFSKNDIDPKKVCGIHYFVKIFVGDQEYDIPRRRYVNVLICRNERWNILVCNI